ncbi:MAG: ATP-binding protein [Aristaeellaceae bacterium]
MSDTKKRRGMNLRLIFILVTMLEIMATLVLAAILSALLGHLLNTTIQVHPLLWLILCSIGVGMAISITVNIFMLRPVVRLSRAMKRVAQGDFSVQLQADSRIAEIRDSYHSFNLMVQALAATETLQSDFVSNVSHEFKTPINAIEGYAMLLQGSHSPQEQAGYVERILLNTRRLSTLVGNILLISRVDNQTIRATPTTYRLDEQIRQAVVLLEPEWTNKDIEFDVDMEEITFTGVENLMQHVWNNLIGNAIKFDPQGGLVRIRLHRAGEHAVFTVEDSGPGIPEKEQQFIFNKFYQSDSSHRQEGNGLGLALVKRVLDSCGGKVTVSNREQGGSCFCVILPLPAV